jgi:ketosteroid isomerase-like protein
MASFLQFQMARRLQCPGIQELIMQRHLIAIGAVLVGHTLAVAGCDRQPQGAASAAEPTAAWTEAFNARNSEALAALYAEDARSLPPGEAAVVGRAAIETYWREDIGAGRVTTRLTPADVFGDDERILVEGRYEVAGEDGVELTRGQYQQLWDRSSGSWLIRREMWRMDPAMHRDITIAEGLTGSWTKAYNAGNVKGLTALYAQDAAISSVQDGTFSGAPAIEGFWTRDLAGNKPSSALTLTDVYMAGEMLHLEGDYAVKEGASTTEGRYIQMWMRGPEGWRIHREMWWR